MNQDTMGKNHIKEIILKGYIEARTLNNIDICLQFACFLGCVVL
jgi:hypothetical protein